MRWNEFYARVYRLGNYSRTSYDADFVLDVGGDDGDPGDGGGGALALCDGADEKGDDKHYGGEDGDLDIQSMLPAAMVILQLCRLRCQHRSHPRSCNCKDNIC